VEALIQTVMMGPGDLAWLEPETDEDRQFLLTADPEWTLEQMLAEARSKGLFDAPSKP
jgi:metal-sulfur cluster biosynthetic enzyme